jgi:molybdopterin-guanine dinucleotide biosynthesis adapter protein
VSAVFARHGATPRVVSFVGRSGSGKTTLMERVIALLTARGIRVGVVKHHAHDIELDVPRKDSWRHAQAGAVSTVVSGPHQFALFQKVEQQRSLAQLIALMDDVDVVLTEGFAAQATACVEVLRRDNAREPVCTAAQLVAIATDLEPESLPPAIGAAVKAGSITRYDLDDALSMADAIADGLPAKVVR